VEAAKRLRDMLGAAYTPQVMAHLAQHFADGVPEDQLAAVAALFTGADQATPAAGLRVVGGGAA
jgi:hypothetical protein